jgi:hypothetical protein
MTSNPSEKDYRNYRSFFYTLIIGALMLILALCATLTITPSLASALIDAPSPTANLLSWSVAEIAKPTYTPSPLPTITPTPIDPPTSAPSPTDTTPLLTMNIVEDSDANTLNTQVYSSNTVDQGQINSGGKYILVSISEQHLSAYENGQLIYSFIASTGMGNSTRIGKFSVLDKIPNAYGATWNIWMPNWLGIYYAGSLEDGIHALPILPSGARLWSGFLGTPISFGCVVLGVDESLQLFNWADIGTPVEIQR